MTTEPAGFVAPPQAVRVFVAFRHRDLPADRFRLELGQTFMPGTPYMLQPLGLAAYLPAVFPEVEGRALPQEVALVTWPSQPAQRRATRETLRGRIYTQSHGGVYGATTTTFPIAAEKFDPRIEASLYLFDDETDWQAGSYCVFGGLKRDARIDSIAFRKRVRDTLVAARGALTDAGADQCIASLHDAYVVIWTHFDAPKRSPFLWSALEESVTAGENLVGARVICREDPPTVTIAGAAAFNFIFPRQPENFLR